MQLMDVMVAYLYGLIDSDIYIKVPDGYLYRMKSRMQHVLCQPQQFIV
jgi:hypothetical protein